MIYELLAFCLLLFIAHSEYIVLNTSPLFVLSYSFPQNDTIRFNLSASSQGYMGIGFGTQMAGTNILVGYQSNGVFVVKDTTCYGHSAPVDHSIQNVDLISGSRNGSGTMITFDRLLNTGDSNDYVITPFTSVPIIWALGNSDALVTHQIYGKTTLIFKQCSPLCLTCSGPSTTECLTCETGFTLSNGSCVALQCNSSCLSCVNDSYDICASCPQGYQLDNGYCMLVCDSSCHTCSDSSNTSCLSCTNGKYLDAGSCLDCHSNCLTCDGGNYSQCLTCENDKYLFYDGGCILNFSQYSLNNSQYFSYILNESPRINLIFSYLSSSLLNITMEFYTQGFISIGFGESMLQADIILAYMNGSMILEDRTSTKYGKPSLDDIQTCDLISHMRTTEKTSVTFQRLIITNSSINYEIDPKKTVPLIWAFGASDTFTYHGANNRNETFVAFFQCDSTCKTCSGPMATDCIECPENFTLKNNQCFSLNCHSSCKTCNGSTYKDCLLCDESTQTLNDGSCVLKNHILENASYYTVVLNQNPLIRLNYTYVSNDKIGIMMDFQTQGYIAIGFGFNMSNADIILAYENETNQINIHDMTSSGHSVPVDDVIQDVNLWSSERSSYGTVAMITRKMNTQDAKDYLITPNATTPLIWAYGSSDSIVYHKANRGMTFVAFKQNASQSVCGSFCLECFGSVCLLCNSNYSLHDGQCILKTCPENCTSCNETQYCLQCDQGFTLKNGLCEASGSIYNTVILNSSPLILFNYTFPNSNTIEIIMEFHTQGYIGIGFGSSMIGADMIIAYKENDAFVLKSVSASSYSKPIENAQQNLVLLSSLRDSEKTVVAFQKPFNTSLNDSNNDFPMIWGYGSGDNFVKHIGKGFQNVKISLNNNICDATCLTCSGPSANQCLSCESTASLQEGYCVNSSSNSNANSLLQDLTSELQIDENFYLYWKFNTNNTITMAFRWNTGGYIALGFGTSMSNIDIISAESSANGFTVYDRWSSSQTMPSLDSEIGGKNDLTSLGALSSDSQGYKIVKFIRNLDTGDKFDYVISQKNETFCYAFSDSSTIGFHGSNVFKFSFEFVEGFKGQANLQSNEKSYLIQAHGIGLLIVWSFLVDIALIIVRYFKKLKNYVEIHASLFFILDVFTLIIVFLVIGKNGESLEFKFQTDKVITAHFALGIIILNLIVCQHVFGFLIKRALESKKMNYFSSKLPKLKNAHKFLGYSIYLITKVNVLTGIWIYDYQELFIGFCVYFGFLFLIRIIIEKTYEKNFAKNVSDIMSPVKPVAEFSDILRDLELQAMPLNKLAQKYPTLKWCMLNNSIYNLKNFDHPGGKYIIEQINGREIGRFFFGAYALENSDLKPYCHSVYAKQILDKRHVGEIIIEEINILQAIPSKKMTNDWSIVKKTKLSNCVSKFEFQSPCFIVKNNIKGVKWFGRHFTITSIESNHKKTRLYTTVICFTEANILFRKQLLDYFFRKTSKSDEIDFSGLSAPALVSDTLPLIIKRYNTSGALSAFIHHANQEIFEIKGPHGYGLELNQNSNGNHVIFCGGTGILPFLDLLDYLLKKSIYQVLLMLFGKEEADKTNVFNEDYMDNFGSKFKVLLFGAFQSKEEFEYLNFIIELYIINKKYNLNNFDMNLRFSDGSTIEDVPTTHAYFDDKFFENHVVPDLCSRIFVCGNPKMNKSIPEICLRNQIEKEKIMIV